MFSVYSHVVSLKWMLLVLLRLRLYENLYEEQKDHNGQQYVADIQMDITVLYPAQPVEQPHDRTHDHTHHVTFGNVIDMAAVMGFFRKPTSNGRVFFLQRGDRPEKFKNRSCV